MTTAMFYSKTNAGSVGGVAITQSDSALVKVSDNITIPVTRYTRPVMIKEGDKQVQGVQTLFLMSGYKGVKERVHTWNEGVKTAKLDRQYLRWASVMDSTGNETKDMNWLITGNMPLSQLELIFTGKAQVKATAPTVAERVEQMVSNTPALPSLPSEPVNMAQSSVAPKKGKAKAIPTVAPTLPVENVATPVMVAPPTVAVAPSNGVSKLESLLESKLEAKLTTMLDRVLDRVLDRMFA